MDVRRCRSALALGPAGSLENANPPRMSAEADNSFRMHSYEKRPRKSFRIHCYKFIGLKVPWNQGFMNVRRCRSPLALGPAGSLENANSPRMSAEADNSIRMH